MQRIDENTYIDDTLVTCAEYQLFIDEMREQGKYYQPDHWTSYEFPAGQASSPILGVRHSDAVAFCKWLTKRESKEWKFRLATMEEADTFPVDPIGLSPLGYWINRNYQFAWVGIIPKNARAIDHDRALDLSSHLDIEDVLERNLDLAFKRIRAINLERDYADDARRYIRSVHNALDQALPLALNLDRAFEFSQYYDVGGISIGLFPSYSTPVAIYVDILTLRERIVGRSPAFEGVRLVKQRKNIEDEGAEGSDDEDFYDVYDE